MSGFIGILHSDGRPVDRLQLERMTEATAFRGPDRQDVWLDGSVGFGHTLLKTTFEAEKERQPCSLDGRTRITADARIDGRKELIRCLGLEDKPYGVQAVTDPELILHAYRRWGSGCVDRLLGDFAFAIWDGNRRRLLCARNHFGVKPFYYAHTGDTLLIGNTLETLRRHPSVSGMIDDNTIADFLMFGSSLHRDRTAFAEIRKLPPASLLTWSPGGNPICRRYWRLPVAKPLRIKDSHEAIDRFLALMRTAVGDRMRTRNIGLCLSGGMDSTTVAAMAAEWRSSTPGRYDLRAGTLYDDTWIHDDEHCFSALAADSLNIPMKAVSTAKNRFPGGDDTLHRWQIMPLSEPAKTESDAQLKAFAGDVRVVLTGHGGDPLLDPSPIHAGAFFKSLFFGGLGMALFRYSLTQQTFPRIGLRKNLRRWMGTRPNHGRSLHPPWFNPSFQKRLHLEQRWARHQRVSRPVASHRSGAHWILENPGWEPLFETMDPGVTGETVESRHPFFDLRVVSYLTALPAVPWCVDKMILRRAMKTRLPEKVLRRPKTPLRGFAAYEQLVREPLTGYEGLLETTGIDAYIDTRRLTKLMAHPEKLYPEEYPWITRPLGLALWLGQPQPERITIEKEICHGKRG